MPRISSTFNSESDFDRKKEELCRQGRAEAIRFLGLAKKPSGRVATKLREKDFDEAIIDAVIASLEQDGYLDDAALARKLARQRQGRKAEAKRALRQRLQNAGLPAAAVEAGLSVMPPDEQSIADLFAARFSDLKRQFSQLEDSQKRQAYLKTARFLSRRGYREELVRGLLSEILSDIDKGDGHEA